MRAAVAQLQQAWRYELIGSGPRQRFRGPHNGLLPYGTLVAEMLQQLSWAPGRMQYTNTVRLQSTLLAWQEQSLQGTSQPLQTTRGSRGHPERQR